LPWRFQKSWIAARHFSCVGVSGCMSAHPGTSADSLQPAAPRRFFAGRLDNMSWT
jgi:hypothetical protein